jgi:hypothetical protein
LTNNVRIEDTNEILVNIFNDGEKSVIQKEFTYKEDFSEQQL